ncbi:SDR family NAD(P)-dependent oxidoreductase [Roseomonas elaeocarpi]|uniref:SDR family NAD(P)-dependent oxidoreductase n=1 Tax=Roseomonas elaeocarpi TaxID=907779 RepID=A0ABV6JMA7_9PROT
MARAGFAVVTGASSGIGLELARQFASHGFDLLVTSRGQGLDEAAAMLRDLGAEVTVAPADLSTEEGVEALVRAIQDTGRPLDALAINAGIGAGGAFVPGVADRTTALEDELSLLRLNVVAVVHLAKRLLPAMVQRGEGRVLFTSSISGTTPVPFEAVYGASKAFVLSFAEAIRTELKDSGVTVTTLLPQQTETAFFHKAGEDDTKVGAGPKADPADVACQGFEALMAGRDKVFGGGLAVSFEGRVLNRVLPDSIKAERHARLSEPGSAN